MKKTTVGCFTIFFVMLSLIAISGFLQFHVYDRPQIPSLPYGTMAYEEYQYELVGEHIGSILWVIVFYLLASYFLSWYHRLKKIKKSTLTKEDVKSPFTLYLRSFIDDKTAQKTVSTTHDTRSEEEILVDVMSDIAPVYAIGDPKDKETPLGAQRIYVPDEHWKSTVVDLATRAEAVVLRLGKTDSFWWEVQMALKNIPREKLLFVIPTSDSFDSVQILYKYLVEQGIDTRDFHVSVGKKKKGSISCVLYFDDQGSIHSTELKFHRFTGLFISYDNVLRKALEGFRSRFGLHAPINKFKASGLLLLAMIVLPFIIVILNCISDMLELYNNSY